MVAIGIKAGVTIQRLIIYTKLDSKPLTTSYRILGRGLSTIPTWLANTLVNSDYLLEYHSYLAYPTFLIRSLWVYTLLVEANTTIT